MEKINLKKEVKEIPLDQLELNLAQVRQKNVGQDIQELAESIRKVGQLEPIIVCPAEEQGKYEIIAGQRRFLAHKEIGAKTIQAVIIDRPLDEYDAKALSLTENWHRLGLSKADEINACLLLWRRYKSIDMIVNETKLPATKVRENLKYESLIDPLKKMVDKGQVEIGAAVRAQTAASVSGKTDEKEAITIAKEMTPLSDAARKRIVDERVENPKKDLEDVFESAKSGKDTIRVVAVITKDTHQALRKYAKSQETNQENAAANLIEEGLVNKGFLGTD